MSVCSCNAFSAVTQSVEFKQRVSRGSGIVEVQTCPYGAETSAVQMLPVGCRQSRVDKKHSPRQCHLHLFMTTSQWDAQERKIDATSSLGYPRLFFTSSWGHV